MSLYRINKLYEELMWFAKFVANDTGYHRFPKLLKARISELHKYGVFPTLEVKEKPWDKEF